MKLLDPGRPTVDPGGEVPEEGTAVGRGEGGEGEAEGGGTGGKVGGGEDHLELGVVGGR